CVAVGGRELDDKPRSVEFSAANPEHYEYDPDDDEGYCLVNEEQIPVYGGLVALRLARRTLHIQLTRRATRTRGLPSSTMRVNLSLDNAEIEQLRVGLDRLFSYRSGWQPTPRVDLG